MAGKRGRAGEDLRTDSGRERSPGIKPGLLESLFSGGVAKGTAQSDLRMGRSAAKPGEGRMLFAGGKLRSLATEDLRMGAKGEGQDQPQNMKMLADGGEVDDDDQGGDGGSVSDAEIVAAEDIMDCLSGGFGYGSSPSDSDSKMEKASKEAARKARAQVFAQALKAFLSIAGG